MGNAILILQRVSFCFQRTALNDVCWVFTRKLDFQKIFSKTDISLISFQQLELNRHDLWNMIFDSRTKKIVEQRRTSIESAKSST